MRNKNLLIGIVLLVVIFNSIVYSALNSEMFINGDAHIRVDKDIRIIDVVVLEQTNGSYETYNSDYSKNTTSMQVTLPSSESVMIYEVTIINKGDIDYEVTNIIEESYSNSNIKYELIDMEDGSIIDRGTTHKFKIKLTTTENNTDNKTTLVLKYTFKEWIPTLYNMVAHKSRGLDTDIDFGVAPTKETSGVYEMSSTKDLEYPVYYYRGIMDNNNVSFAGFCWKIVRTTSTGGVKLIYNGIPGSDGNCDNTSNASLIGTSRFNATKSSVTDASYVYDNGNDSEIKKVIDKWYSDNMIEYTNMLEDEVWCNDRSVYRTDSGAAIRFGQFYNQNHVTTLSCPRLEDSFTVDESNGNGKLSYPIALLTDSELKLTWSSAVSYNNLSYLSIDRDWWTMSPDHFNLVNNTLVQSYVSSKTLAYDVTSISGVRPAISILSGTMIKEGNGSVTNPYKLVEDKITKEWIFDYTGEEQEFRVPYDGIYKLEVWGAQGGSSIKSDTYRGGYGAYSVGHIELKNNQNIYVNVGEMGKVSSGKEMNMIEGGYNGGGLSYHKGAYWIASDSSMGGGGGATHIAYKSGLLSNLSNFQQDVLIVAGAGGGGCWFNADNSGSGGDAGGITGCKSANPGLHTIKYNRYGVGGTQNNGGCILDGSTDLCASFGKGQDMFLNSAVEGCGGGSGYYGGSYGYATGGGGGSSYIGNSLLSNKVMYCYECQESDEESTKTISTINVSEEPISNYAKKGNGYAKITLITKK